MKRIKNVFFAVGIIAVAGVFINAAKKKDKGEIKEESKEVLVDTSFVKDYNVYALTLPENLQFAGEKVPTQLPDIKERIDREFLVNTYWQSNGFLLFKRAHKYFPMIEKILKEEGVPDDFKYLAVIESGLTNAVSPAGARGFWQIMKATGREYGLEVNTNVDERYHLEKATRVACQYLKDAKKKFGSWTLAAASYNAGMSGLAKQLARQEVLDYYDLLLTAETSRYVPRIVALKYILMQPHQFGFNFSDADLYNSIPTFKVKVDSAITNISRFAKGYDINYKILKLHNPWLREAHLNNKSRRVYEIQIPQKEYYTK
ncbi:lytic transglycosylase domain-containing protein [Pseudofulvibacter geojedonensis]|uniref:Transglycosylase SLT domain-containing protein n=1 Tax=Pseudofulvibacter geojedonensis TaxID=1123758 RepID=A0ABW3HZC8_9FLAO